MRTLVLAFHGIGVPPPEIPRAEIPYWMPNQAFSTFIGNADTIANELEIKLFATFDDGNASDLEVAVPLLKENDLEGAFFPCAGRCSNAKYLSPAHLRQIAKLGFEIGSHGFDHIPWTRLDEFDLRRETVDSKKFLEDLLGAEVKSVAIPFGAYNRRVLRAIQEAGYSVVYTSDRGLVRSQSPLKMRWTFRNDEMFDIRNILAAGRRPSHVLITALKKFIKSHR